MLAVQEAHSRKSSLVEVVDAAAGTPDEPFLLATPSQTPRVSITSLTTPSSEASGSTSATSVPVPIPGAAAKSPLALEDIPEGKPITAFVPKSVP